MMRSLYSGVAGLKAHQTKMDVIGNNIANVNTVGYKSQSVTFSDVLYQTTQNATGANAETGRGGTNAKQIGLGASVSAITTNVTGTGGTQTTNNPFDLMINGSSMFIVNNAGTNYFTKAGNFTVDSAGNLVTASGYNVMGWKADNDGNVIKTNVSPINLYSAENKFSSPIATTKNTITGNINKEDETFTSDAGSLSKNLEFYDALGYKYQATVKFTQDSSYSYKFSLSALTCEGKKVDLSGIDATKLAGVFSGTINFSSTTGAVVATDDAPGVYTFKPADLGIPSLTSDITVDMSAITCFGTDSTLSVKAGDANGFEAGRAVGDLTGVSIGTDGKISASYSNNDNRVIGQIAVANFTNLSGLEKVGDNLYQATMNSGDFDGIGDDITSNGGRFTPGSLEMSNVDLAGEFTEMITTQRGYQANSRIITVSDTMLEELINLKR